MIYCITKLYFFSASGDFQDFLDKEIFMAGPGTVQAAVAFLSPGILLWGHLIIFINFPDFLDFLRIKVNMKVCLVVSDTHLLPFFATTRFHIH